jgi:hypothetical protein
MSGRIRSLGSTFLAAAALAAPAAAAPAPPAIVTGQDAGWPDVRGFDRWGSLALGSAPWGTWQLSFAAYPTYQKGVRVAVGDVDGDGRAEIVTAPGREAFTEIRVFDGRTFAQKGSVLPFRNAVWWNGAFVTTGDTDGDGRDEIVDGLDAGCCTTLHVLDATSGADRSGFFPYGNRSEVGARVAAADVNRDGRDELFAVPVGGRRVSLYGPLGGDAFRSFEPFGAEAGSGVTIAAGDVLGDSRPELVAAAATGAGVEVRVVDLGSGRTLATYRAFEAGVSPEVAVADVDGDGHADLVVLARLPDGTKVRTLDSAGALIDDFYVLDATIGAGASLAAGDLDGDRRAEIVLGGGPTTSPWPPAANGPDQRVAVYRADGSPPRPPGRGVPADAPHPRGDPHAHGRRALPRRGRHERPRALPGDHRVGRRRPQRRRRHRTRRWVLRRARDEAVRPPTRVCGDGAARRPAGARVDRQEHGARPVTQRCPKNHCSSGFSSSSRLNGSTRSSSIPSSSSTRTSSSRAAFAASRQSSISKPSNT